MILTYELFQEKYKAALRTRRDVEMEDYSNMQHGWMGARGFYKGEESVKEYERGCVGAYFVKCQF